ncbi:hypothetical protein TNCV_877241 [Trichonephila clavipes]|nr:hypothetical protein TNCV_877241 [Trichonephila clavipes]
MLCDAREFADEIDKPATFELTQPRHRVRRRNVNFNYEAQGDPIEDPTLWRCVVFQELGVIPGTRGWRPVYPERVQQIDDAVATRSSSSRVSMLQQVSTRKLKPDDDTLRIDFTNFVLSKISEDDIWIRRIFGTEEVHFTLSGSITAGYGERATNTLNVKNPSIPIM